MKKENPWKDLGEIGRKNDTSGVVWDSALRADEGTTDRDDVASSRVFWQQWEAILVLETQLHEVNHAIRKNRKRNLWYLWSIHEQIEIDRLSKPFSPNI